MRIGVFERGFQKSGVVLDEVSRLARKEGVNRIFYTGVLAVPTRTRFERWRASHFGSPSSALMQTLWGIANHQIERCRDLGIEFVMGDQEEVDVRDDLASYVATSVPGISFREGGREFGQVYVVSNTNPLWAEDGRMKRLTMLSEPTIEFLSRDMRRGLWKYEDVPRGRLSKQAETSGEVPSDVPLAKAFHLFNGYVTYKPERPATFRLDEDGDLFGKFRIYPCRSFVVYDSGERTVTFHYLPREVQLSPPRAK